MTDGQVNREGQYYDWEKELFRTGVYQTYDLALSGGNETTSYYSSLSYTNDKGRSKTNSFDRISGRVSVNQKVGQYVEFNTSVNLARTHKDGVNVT